MSSSKRNSTFNRGQIPLSDKANWVLNLILVAFVLIILKIWYLSVIQHDVFEERSRRPQKRTLTEPAKRGTIRDRFNLPLAINRIQYNAAMVYSPIKHIPVVQFETIDGKRVKKFKRKEYITLLAQLFANRLSLDKDRVEDLIYSKGALYNRTPFILKEDITEKEYYSLKILEKDWPGLEMQMVPRRYYPNGKVAGDILGYLGAINRSEYENIIHQIAFLEDHLKAKAANEQHILPEGLEEVSKVRNRLRELSEKSYTLNDHVGKSGVELRYERELRGNKGKRSFYADAKGNYLKEFPGSRSPQSGRRILLSISLELQEYAEELLIQHEKLRQTRATMITDVRQKFIQLQAPWIKGGAIVAISPWTGELIALASHPRMDPNDFVPAGDIETNRAKRSNVNKWFETDVHVGEIWDQKLPLAREVWDPLSKQIATEEKMMSWEEFITSILPKGHLLSHELLKNFTITDAAAIGRCAQKLLTFDRAGNGAAFFNALYPNDIAYGKKRASIAPEDKLAIESERSILDHFTAPFEDNYEKILLVDLCRLAVDYERFDEKVISEVGTISLSQFRELSAAMTQLSQLTCEMSKDLFRDTYFSEWRELNGKSFLAEKRKVEKAEKRYAKPYIDLLDSKEREIFTELWVEQRWSLMQVFLTGTSCTNVPQELIPLQTYFLNWFQEINNGAHRDVAWMPSYQLLKKQLEDMTRGNQIPFMQTLRGFRDLTRPLVGRYPSLRQESGVQKEKHLAAAFYPKHGFGYGRSNTYRQATTQGSLFKLVTAYEAMMQKRSEGKTNHPEDLMEITDKVYTIGKETYVGYDKDGKPLPRFYRGGRLPRSTSSNFGKMNVIRAIETSSNPYFALLAGDFLRSPTDLARAAAAFSFGSKTGIDLSAEISGRIPDDLETNRTGLYAMAIGQHSMVVTPLQTSVMLAAIANGGKIITPRVGLMSAGAQPTDADEAISYSQNYKYQDELKLIGIDFPLFLAINNDDRQVAAKKFPTAIKRSIPMPSEERKVLLDGMYKVVQRTQKEGLQALTRLYKEDPAAIENYKLFKKELLGKTSTAESIERVNLSQHDGVHIYNHVWFGGIVFNKDDHTHPQKLTFVAKDQYGTPELVVVVYLRFGGFGKESAPVAAQIAAKWREIKTRHGK